jgi:hypothetical protein
VTPENARAFVGERSTFLLPYYVRPDVDKGRLLDQARIQAGNFWPRLIPFQPIIPGSANHMVETVSLKSFQNLPTGRNSVLKIIPTLPTGRNSVRKLIPKPSYRSKQCPWNHSKIFLKVETVSLKSFQLFLHAETVSLKSFQNLPKGRNSDLKIIPKPSYRSKVPLKSFQNLPTGPNSVLKIIPKPSYTSKQCP